MASDETAFKPGGATESSPTSGTLRIFDGRRWERERRLDGRSGDLSLDARYDQGFIRFRTSQFPLRITLSLLSRISIVVLEPLEENRLDAEGGKELSSS